MFKYVLRALIIDFIVISGTIIISQYFPDYKWFVSLVLIIISIMGILTFIFGLCEEDVKKAFYKAFDKRKNTSIYWKLYDPITDLILTGCLVYYQFKVTTAFFILMVIFANTFKAGYYKDGEKQNAN